MKIKPNIKQIYEKFKLLIEIYLKSLFWKNLLKTLLSLEYYKYIFYKLVSLELT